MRLLFRQKQNKTFKHNGHRLKRCPCAADTVIFIPNGYEGETRLYTPSCGGCGRMVPNIKMSSPNTAAMKSAWNAYMTIQQEIYSLKEEEETDDTDGDEKA